MTYERPFVGRTALSPVGPATHDIGPAAHISQERSLDRPYSDRYRARDGSPVASPGERYGAVQRAIRRGWSPVGAVPANGRVRAREVGYRSSARRVRACEVARRGRKGSPVGCWSPVDDRATGRDRSPRDQHAPARRGRRPDRLSGAGERARDQHASARSATRSATTGRPGAARDRHALDRHAPDRPAPRDRHAPRDRRGYGGRIEERAQRTAPTGENRSGAVGF